MARAVLAATLSSSWGVYGPPAPGPRGERVGDDDMILLLNSHHEPHRFTNTPSVGPGWELAIDTAAPIPLEPGTARRRRIGASTTVASRSIRVPRRDHSRPLHPSELTRTETVAGQTFVPPVTL